MLRRLIWSSVPSTVFSITHLVEVTTLSRRYNERHHISGMLLFTGAHFLSILEGDGRDLDPLWLRLARDDRHYRLSRVGDNLCGNRQFPDWVTAYVADPDVDAQIESLRPVPSWVETSCATAGTPGGMPGPSQPRSPPMWSQIIHPIMMRGDSM